MIIKNYIDYNFLAEKKFFYLIYGENLSLIDEIKNNFLFQFKNNFYFTIKYYQEQFLIENPDTFIQFLCADNLFAKKELLVINNSTDKILDLLNRYLIPCENKKIIFISNNLIKKSKLRSLAEASENFACIACYQDDQAQLQSLLIQKLKNIKINVSREFINSIFEMNSLNRQDINDAINKTILIKNSSNIDQNKLKELFHSSSNNNNFEIVNVCLLGNKKNINIALNNIYAQGINFNEILSALKYKANKLIEILESNSENKNINQLVESFKPAIFWKEKNITKEQLKRWSKPDLERLLDKIFDIEIQCKKNYDVSTTILQNFVINISTKTALPKSALHQVKFNSYL